MATPGCMACEFFGDPSHGGKCKNCVSGKPPVLPPSATQVAAAAQTAARDVATLHSDADDVDDDGEEEIEQMAEHVFQQTVYIEDTDAYQILYHANYLKYWDRARQDIFGTVELGRLRDEEGITLRVRRMDRLRFRSSATLGVTCDIVTKLHHMTETTVVWGHHALSPAKEVYCNGLVETCFWDSNRGCAVPPPSSVKKALKRLSVNPSGTRLKDIVRPGRTATSLGVTAYADELDSTGCLSHVALIRFFERDRNTALGGPDQLERLKTDNYLIVVVIIDKIVFQDDQPTLGEKLEIRTSMEAKAGNTMLLFHQSLWRTSSNTMVASGDVTCACISGDERKMTPVPDWVLQHCSK